MQRRDMHCSGVSLPIAATAAAAIYELVSERREQGARGSARGACDAVRRASCGNVDINRSGVIRLVVAHNGDAVHPSPRLPQLLQDVYLITRASKMDGSDILRIKVTKMSLKNYVYLKTTGHTTLIYFNVLATCIYEYR